MKISDNGKLLYLTGIDTKLAVSVVLIYQVAVPAVLSFYHTFMMKTVSDGLILNTFGKVGDYVTVTSGA